MFVVWCDVAEISDAVEELLHDIPLGGRAVLASLRVCLGFSVVYLLAWRGLPHCQPCLPKAYRSAVASMRDLIAC